MSPKYLRIEEINELHEVRLSPDKYKVNDELVKPQRYNKIKAGGVGPKDGLKINNTPGPGSYDTFKSMIQDLRSKILKGSRRDMFTPD